MGYYFNNVDIITQSGRWLSETSHHLLRRCWEAKLGAENVGRDLREFGKRSTSVLTMLPIMRSVNNFKYYHWLFWNSSFFFFFNLTLNGSVVLQRYISVGILSFLSIRGFFLIQDYYLTVADGETKNANMWFVSTTTPGYCCDQCYRNACQEKEEKILFLY